MSDDVTVTPADPAGAPARAALCAYYDDIVTRWHGRPATAAEVDELVAGAGDDRLVPPHGLLLLARRGPDVLGCAGLRVLDGVGEVTRLHVAATARGRGVGTRLLGAVEARARGLGLRVLRLETRRDLVEARRLYARHGFTETERFTDDPYAHHCLAKRLDPAHPDG
ncbi:GNAT family N-acetyltransferase [Kineococcus sp. SYSU DK002]|uniref:GNAT family N-acetyltransferase n=1 Tax=Kineococcus sp. SYSU DK002 TaxID=3383123 RepID=UPI003D7E8786